MQQVAHYRILETLGEGAMGVVYKARDINLNRLVAIKMLHASRKDERVRKRFADEARTASRLNHPNIVTIHDATGDYLVMEYVPGVTLEKTLAAGPLPARSAISYASQIAAGLAAAHALGVVHRDLKPGNILIAPEGRVKILDFGLAKVLDRHSAGLDETQTAREAQSTQGAILGTVAYMSPEQAEGKPVDARTDIFSFGVVLYEMLTGRHPFRRESGASTLAAILREHPRPADSAGAGAIVSRCLRKDRDLRPSSIADVRNDLDELLLSLDRPAAAPSFRRPSRRAAIVAAGIVGLAISAAAWMHRATPAPESFHPAVPLTFERGFQRSPTLSPDGAQLAYSWNGEREDNYDIYVRTAGAGTPHRLTTDPQPDIAPAWSPDGRWIAFLRREDADESSLWIVPSLGGPSRMLARLTSAFAGYEETMTCAWSSDSRWIAAPAQVGEAAGIALIPIDTGALRMITAPAAGTFDGSPAFSADGRTLLFFRYRGPAKSELWEQPLTAGLQPHGSARKLHTPAGAGFQPLALPSGDILFHRLDNSRRDLLRIPRGGRQTAIALADASSAHYSARTRRLVFSRRMEDENIHRLSLDDGSISVWNTSTLRDVSPEYAPNAARVAFTSARSGSLQIWVAEPDGSSPRQLTALAGARVTGTPRWSPDSRWITFDSDAAGHYDVYAISTAGGAPRKLTAHPGSDFGASWSPDGKWIYFTSDRGGSLALYRMRFEGGDGSEAEPVLARSLNHARLAPDGRFLYYTPQYTNSPLCRVPLVNGRAGAEKEDCPIASVMRHNFTIATTGIYFVPGDSGEGQGRIDFYRFRDGATREVARIGRPARLGLTLSCNEKELLFSRADRYDSNVFLADPFE